jgi:hypothetical protein
MGGSGRDHSDKSTLCELRVDDNRCAGTIPARGKKGHAARGKKGHALRLHFARKERTRKERRHGKKGHALRLHFAQFSCLRSLTSSGCLPGGRVNIGKKGHALRLHFAQFSCLRSLTSSGCLPGGRVKGPRPSVGKITPALLTSIMALRTLWPYLQETTHGYARARLVGADFRHPQSGGGADFSTV